MRAFTYERAADPVAAAPAVAGRPGAKFMRAAPTCST